MQRVVNILSSAVGLNHEPPNYLDIHQLDSLLEAGWKVVQITSHGFVPNTIGVMMTVLLEKPDPKKGGNYSATAG